MLLRHFQRILSLRSGKLDCQMKMSALWFGSLKKFFTSFFREIFFLTLNLILSFHAFRANSFKMFPQEKRKVSTEEMRKLSTISLGTFNQAIDQLERYIVKKELPAEEMVYNIFKLPNKDEGNIGKLITVSPQFLSFFV